MCSLYLNTKEVAKRLGVKSKLVDKIFRTSKIPTIHRDNSGNKILIEKDNFILLQEVLTVIIESMDNTVKYSNKKLALFRLHFLFLLLSQYKQQDATQFTLLADVNDLYSVSLKKS